MRKSKESTLPPDTGLDTLYMEVRVRWVPEAGGPQAVIKDSSVRREKGIPLYLRQMRDGLRALGLPCALEVKGTVWEEVE